MENNQNQRPVPEAKQTDGLNYSEHPVTFQSPFGAGQRTISGGKDDKKSLIKTILAAVILVILIAVAVFYVLNTNTQNGGLASTELSAIKVTDTVKEALSAKYTVVANSAEVKGEKAILINTTQTAPYWRIAGVDYYVNYSGNDASKIEVNFDASSSDIDVVGTRSKAVVTAIVNSLVNQGFTKSVDSPYNIEFGLYRAYTKNDVVCVTNNQDIMIVSGLNVSCGLISKYVSDLDEFKDVMPLANAYKTAGQKITKGLAIGPVISKSSETQGYTVATANIWEVGSLDKKTGYFFKQDSGSWKYFNSVTETGMLQCGVYKTDEVKSAFKGESCVNGNSVSKVK